MTMGLVVALLNPFINSIMNVLAKIGIERKDTEDMAVLFYRLFFPLFVLVPALLYVGSPVYTDPLFWAVILIMGLFEERGQWFFHQAIKGSLISSVMPLSALLTIPLLGLALFKGEINALGITGVLIITCGIYSHAVVSAREEDAEDLQRKLLENKNLLSEMDADDARDAQDILGGKFSFKDWWTPLKRLWTKQKSRYMLYTVAFWTVTTYLQPEAIKLANPNFEGPVNYQGIVYMGVMFLLCSSLVILIKRIISGKSVKAVVFPPQLWRLLPIGLLFGFACICQYWAVSVMSPVYMIALKDTVLIWAMIFDKTIFREKIGRAQIISTLMVMIGSMMIAVATDFIQNS